MKEDVKAKLIEQVDLVFSEFGIIIAIFIIGFIVGFFFKEYVSDRNYRKQVELRIKDKDVIISDLKQIVHERSKKVTSTNISEPDMFKWWRKIVKFFKTKKPEEK